MARRLAALEGELAEARRQIARLEAEAVVRPDPEFTVDATGLVLGLSPRAALWCEEVGAPSPRHVADLFAERDAEAVAALAEGGWTGVTDQRFRTHTGRAVTLNVAAVEGLDGHWRVTARDVTARVAMDAALDEQRRALAIARLAGAVARELTDPIAVVQGRIELLLTLGALPPEARDRHLGVALEHARRAAGIVHNLRHVGTVTTPDIESVQVDAVVARAREMLGGRAPEIPFRVDISPADLALGGDLDLCARAVLNVATYLHDRCSRGDGVQIRARRRGEVVLLQVGCGTAFDELLRRQPEEESESFEDSLGLSVAVAIARALGGLVERRRLPNAACVTLGFPRAPARRSRRAEGHVLFVGSADEGDRLSRLLGPDGYRFERVPSAVEALMELERRSYSAVIAELVLPAMSGLTFLEEALRRRADLRGRAILLAGAEPPSAHEDICVLVRPARRMALLQGLGRQARRRR